MFGRETWRKRTWSSLQKSDRIVPAGSHWGFLIQQRANTAAKRITRNSGWWGTGSSPCSQPREKGLSASPGGGWGKDLLLPVPSGPTVLPATQDRDPEPRAPPRHQHNQEQDTASTRKGFRVFTLFAKTWGPCKCHYKITVFYLALEVVGVEQGN